MSQFNAAISWTCHETGALKEPKTCQRRFRQQNIILLLTNNLLEAADLTEQIEQRGIGNVVILRSAADALHCFDQQGCAPTLIIFGLPCETEQSRDVLARARQNGCRILLIDGPICPSSSPGLMRPYTSSDVDLAFRRLGVLT
jgi:hypothetical protein